MDAILGLFNNPVVLNLLGLVMKFVPGIRTVIANKLIPLILTVVSWISQVVSPATAHAASFTLPGEHVLLGGIGGGFVGSLASAVIQAAKAWALNEMFTRHFAPPKPADSK